MTDTEKRLDAHIVEAKSDFKEIKDEIKVIKDNHLHTLDVDMKEVKTDLGWLKKWHFAVSVPAAIGAVAGIANLVK